MITVCVHCGPQVADRDILEEVMLMVLEMLNSTLTHNLHNNPHLVYSLLYQREVFEPYKSHPSLMGLIQNIETVSSNNQDTTHLSPPSSFFSPFHFTSYSHHHNCLSNILFPYLPHPFPNFFPPGDLLLCSSSGEEWPGAIFLVLCTGHHPVGL